MLLREMDPREMGARVIQKGGLVRQILGTRLLPKLHLRTVHRGKVDPQCRIWQIPRTRLLSKLHLQKVQATDPHHPLRTTLMQPEAGLPGRLALLLLLREAGEVREAATQMTASCTYLSVAQCGGTSPAARLLRTGSGYSRQECLTSSGDILASEPSAQACGQKLRPSTTSRPGFARPCRTILTTKTVPICSVRVVVFVVLRCGCAF